MSKQTEAIKLAIEVFGGDWHDEIVDTDWADKANNAITVLREALAEQPAQRKPLTEEQIRQVFRDLYEKKENWLAYARAIEAAHNIKE